VSHEAAEVTAHDAVPGWALPFIKLSQMCQPQEIRQQAVLDESHTVLLMCWAMSYAPS